MGCECFDPRVSAVNIQKGFEKSFVSGVKAVVRVGKDLLARGKELSGANFSQNYEIVGGRLHWEGDEHPVEYHLRRYTAWLIGRGASPDLVLQSKLDRQVFKQVQEAALQLRDGMTINWLSFKTTNPSDGAAFHQLAIVNGKLVQRSRLLPFEDADQMSRLVTVMSQNRDDLSVATDDGLSPLLGWVTMGKAVDFDKELPVMVRESSWVNQQEVGVPIHMIESMSGGAGVDVHLGSGHEEVSVTEAPKYQAPVVVFSAVEEMITEVVQPHPRGGNVDEVIKSVKPEAVIWAKPRDIVVEQPVVPSVVTLVLVANELQTREDTEVTEGAEKVVVPQVMRMIPVGDEIRVAILQSVVDRQVVEYQERKSVRIEEAITENTEVSDSTEKVVVPTVTRMILVSGEASEVTVTELPKYEEITVSDVHLGSVHEPKEEVITEVTEITEGTETLVVSDSSDQAEVITEGTEIVIFSAVSDQVSALSVIREAFNIELVTEHKSVKSVKDKLIWLGRNIANIVADQLMGRKMQEKKDKNVFGWLVHGLAMMQFDGIEEKRKMRRFSLSPVRVWADRVTKVVKRVKSKFRQSVYGAYNHLFVTT